MKLRSAFAACIAAAFLAAVPASYAAVTHIQPEMHAFFHGEKQVKFNLRNETGVPLELKIGDKTATLKDGEVMPLKLPVGTRVVTNTATDRLKAGDVLVEVSASMYSDSTITIGK